MRRFYVHLRIFDYEAESDFDRPTSHAMSGLINISELSILVIRCHAGIEGQSVISGILTDRGPLFHP